MPSLSNTLSHANRQPLVWLAIALLCLGLDAIALYFQHVLNLLPCELCIYVRVWLLAIALCAFAGLGLCRWRWPRRLLSLASLLLSLGLGQDTWNLIKVEYAIGNGGSCGFFANFPSWAPLDKWLPSVFEVQEFCQATPEVLFGITMAEGLVVVSLALVLGFVGFIYAEFKGDGNYVADNA